MVKPIQQAVEVVTMNNEEQKQLNFYFSKSLMKEDLKVNIVYEVAMLALRNDKFYVTIIKTNAGYSYCISFQGKEKVGFIKEQTFKEFINELNTSSLSKALHKLLEV